MVLVLGVAFVLTSMTFRAAAPVITTTSTRNAEDALRALHAKARARAIGQGTPATLLIDPVGDSAWIVQNGAQVDRFDFGKEYKADLRAFQTIQVCMTPRGVGDPDCSNPTPANLAIQIKDQTVAVAFLPMGQLVEGFFGVTP